ncbi:MAG: hypothetical protein G01um101418_389 [Parcubacteria group bacterium Gr01-1014_18]|nr:MAG: hypothetical protein Greene041636_365 [Parcubacteria group bacterium Greene0416_36]TSC81110.1 MAG: hypothetical protein G01um101418_389 [Parcubacteria group bacterium Gr01-1014_18]TSC98474.1 MAG: hypothetical protein Greene101420_711 [Parcubacteria group bacterium Greene1014_20]TSD07361.1 MAG: hypothetical protein Greene07142_216 [Parcubacteria group bacterium Greene0714_2]
MKLVARIQGENQNTVATLTARQITAKLVKGAIIVDLAKNELGGYGIPTECANATLSIDVEESGGGMTNTGSGTIVCGLSGKALKPYYMPRGGHRACGTHAHFSVPNAVVTITAGKKSGILTINKYTIRKEMYIARIESEKIWSGQIEELPNIFAHYKEAAEAADRKSQCYHCKCVHFKATS